MTDEFNPRADRVALEQISELHARLILQGRSDLDVAVALLGAACAIFLRAKGAAFLAEMLFRESRRTSEQAHEALRAQAREYCAANLDKMQLQGRA